MDGNTVQKIKYVDTYIDSYVRGITVLSEVMGHFPELSRITSYTFIKDMVLDYLTDCDANRWYKKVAIILKDGFMEGRRAVLVRKSPDSITEDKDDQMTIKYLGLFKLELCLKVAELVILAYNTPSWDKKPVISKRILKIQTGISEYLARSKRNCQ